MKPVYESAEDFIKANKGRFEVLGQRSGKASEIIKLYNGKSGGSENLAVLHGLWAHEKAIAAGLKVHSFLLCPGLAKWQSIACVSARIVEAAERCYVISGRTYARISQYDDSDGILSLARLPDYKPEDLTAGGDGVIFVMDGLVKPGNVGVILRSCDGAGVSAVFICRLRTRVTHPNAIKASMGAAFSVPVVPFEDAVACREWLVRNGYTIYVADPKVKTCYRDLPYEGKTAVVMGNEHIGASETWYEGGAVPFAIPMHGSCDSLNVSIAAAILAYEIRGRRAGSVP